jgi:paraquat-inducible protein B
MAGEIRGTHDALAQLKAEFMRSFTDTTTNVQQLGGEMQRARASLDGITRRLEAAESTAMHLGSDLGSRLESLATEQRQSSHAATLGIEGLKRDLTEINTAQASDRQRLSDVVKKSMEVQTLKQSDLEARMHGARGFRQNFLPEECSSFTPLLRLKRTGM